MAQAQCPASTPHPRHLRLLLAPRNKQELVHGDNLVPATCNALWPYSCVELEMVSCAFLCIIFLGGSTHFTLGVREPKGQPPFVGSPCFDTYSTYVSIIWSHRALPSSHPADSQGTTHGLSRTSIIYCLFSARSINPMSQDFLTVPFQKAQFLPNFYKGTHKVW